MSAVGVVMVMQVMESVGCLHLLFSSFNDFAISSSKHCNSAMYQSYGLEVQIMDPHE